VYKWKGKKVNWAIFIKWTIWVQLLETNHSEKTIVELDEEPYSDYKAMMVMEIPS
jgi:hypothetical protein